MPEYLNLRGHNIYNYEWDNQGEAVVLLHGGLSKTSSWDYLVVPALEDEFHVLDMTEQHMDLPEISQEVCTLNSKRWKQLLI